MEGNGKVSDELLSKILEALLDVRTSIDGTNDRLDRINASLGARIDATNAELARTRNDLGARIDGTNAELARTRNDLGARIDGTNAELVQTREDLGARIDDAKTELREEIHALKMATSAGFDLLARTNSQRDVDVVELRSRLDRIEEHIGLRPAP